MRATFERGWAVLLLSFAASMTQAQTVTLDQVKGALSPNELLALGAYQVDAAEFQSTVVGRTLAEEGWTWIIGADGTQTSQAEDGSWSDVGGTWKMEGNQYCRESPTTPYTCADVYRIGGYLRMTDADGALAEWTVQIKSDGPARRRGGR